MELSSASNSDGDDEERPQLSAHSLAALQEFYSEQEEKRRQFDGRLVEEGAVVGPEGGVATVEEDWKLSQFWYDEQTALTLAQEVLDGTNKRIACLSCPTLYAKLLQMEPISTTATATTTTAADSYEIVLLEFDRRFEIYGENFVFYDYANPLELPERLREMSFDVVVADPPYLSRECLEKISQTVKFLTQNKIILCTGAVMENLAMELLSVKMCSFLPRHTRNLANDFRCFTNYESKLLNPIKRQKV